MKSTSSSNNRNPVLQAITRLACIAWLVWAGGSAQATTMSWTNSAGGDYNNAANWSGGLPGSADNAAFNLNNAYTVDLTTSWTNFALQFGANNGTEIFNFHSNTLLLTGDYYWDQYGAGTTNTVFMNNGTIVSTNAAGAPRIGSTLGSVDTLTFSNMTFNANSFGVASSINTIGQGTWNLYNSTATITNFNLANSSGNAGGSSGTGNVLVASGSVLSVSNPIVVGQGGNSSGHKGIITVSNGTFNANGGLTLGYDPSCSGSLSILDNGHVFIGGTIAELGTRYDNSYGSILINGSNALLAVPTANLWVGQGLHESTLTINNGACVISNGALIVGSWVGTTGRVTMTGGSLNAAGLVVGQTDIDVGLFPSGSIWLAGPNNPVMTITGNAYLAQHRGNNGLLVVSNGTFHVTADMYMNWIGPSESHMVVAGGTVQVDNEMDVGGGAGGTSTVFVTNGGVLENHKLYIQVTIADSPAWVTNNGGVFQYTTPSPSITPGTFGNLGIYNGAVSFRGIDTADVFCNQSGKALDSTTKMAFFGTNAFRLNNASNSLAVNQTYTFAPGTATNFARLELLNGSTYRHGSVTIGAGGSLYLSSGASTISTVLTAAPSSTIEFDLSNTNAPGCLLSTTNM